ncbi:MAG: acetylxylan esterase [Candidatus Omnitrophica bacterium]|nr:acetylxylan esterase [Candidatus Omnitrophota bacterium]
MGAALLAEVSSVNASIFFGPEAPESPRRIEYDPEARRKQLHDLMGDLPDRERPIQVRKLDETERDGYLLETLELDLNGIEMVPAYFSKPKNADGPLPTILFNHSHGGGYDIGKKEFIEGRRYLQPKPYAQELAEQGWNSLCIDHWVFGERSHTAEGDMFKSMLWQGRVLWGMMVFDSLKAVDYLVGRPDVDKTRLGTLGISMGSTMAWWLAALDTRIKATVDICCLTEFHTLIREKGLGRHGVYYFVPGLLKYFTTADINALIAPRAHLGLAGLQDGLTPVEGLDIIDEELKKVYSDMGVPENWKLLRYDVKHQETEEGRIEILKFLQTHLA